MKKKVALDVSLPRAIEIVLLSPLGEGIHASLLPRVPTGGFYTLSRPASISLRRVCMRRGVWEGWSPFTLPTGAYARVGRADGENEGGNVRAGGEGREDEGVKEEKEEEGVKGMIVERKGEDGKKERREEKEGEASGRMIKEKGSVLNGND